MVDRRQRATQVLDAYNGRIKPGEHSSHTEALSPICPAAHCPVPQLRIVQNAAADELLGHDPLALVIGMLLDQHVSTGAEHALPADRASLV